MTFSAGDKIRLTEKWPVPTQAGLTGHIMSIHTDGSIHFKMQDGQTPLWRPDGRTSLEAAYESLRTYVEVVEKAPSKVHIPALDGWLKRSRV